MFRQRRLLEPVLRVDDLHAPQALDGWDYGTRAGVEDDLFSAHQRRADPHLEEVAVAAFEAGVLPDEMHAVQLLHTALQAFTRLS